MSSTRLLSFSHFSKDRRGPGRGIIVAYVALVLLVFVLTASRNLASPYDSFDEGWRLMAAKLIALGYEPYAEVYDVDAPLYPLVTGLVTRIGLLLDEGYTDSPLPARTVSLVMAIIGAAALALIGSSLYGSMAGMVAGTVMLFTPLFFGLARRALPETAAVAMGIVAVWSTVNYWQRRKAGWLVVGGVAFGLSCLFKFIFPFLLLLILLLALNIKHRRLPARLFSSPLALQVSYTNLAWIGLGALLPAVLVILLLDPRTLYEQAWAFHVAGRELDGGILLARDYGTTLWRFAENNTPLMLVSLYALVASSNSKRWVSSLWLGLALAMLAFQSPVRYRYTVILVPPLALLAGLFVQVLAEHLKRPERPGKYIIIILWLGLMAFCLAQLPAIWRENWAETELDKEFIQTISDVRLSLSHNAPESDFILSDEPAMIFYLDKLVPPSIAELSKKRVEIGSIDIQDLAQIAANYGWAPVLTRRNLSHMQRMQGFEQWVTANYLLRADINSPSRDLMLYHTPALDGDCTTTSHPATRVLYGASWNYRCLKAEVADQLTVVSSYFTPSMVEAGDPIDIILSLTVRSAEFQKANLKVFVHLLDTQSNVVAQADHFLFEDALEVVPREVLLADQHSLETVEGLAPGKYRLVVGFYRPDTLERISMEGTLPDDVGAIVLGDVEIR